MIKTVPLLLVIACITFSAATQAAVITNSFSNVMETTDLSQTGTLEKFDTNLGTLNQVTLTLKGASISTTMLENTSDSNQFFSFNSALNFIFDASSVGLSLPNPAFSTTLASTEGFVNLGSGITLDLGTKEDSGIYVFTGTDISNFLASESMATFALSCNTITESAFTGGGGNISFNQNTEAACGAEIEYVYSARPIILPEPTILLLIGVGLLGFSTLYTRKALSS